jgi:CO/xanthine dehydrogenase Mo-binding subunit
MSEDQKFRWVGTRPVRPDGVDKVTGRANYGADFTLPGMLCGAVLRSPHAHARIVSLDLSGALACEGVKAAVSSDDFPDLPPHEGDGMDFRKISRNCLARDKVLYHGHAVAAVAATSRQLAEQALEAIVVEYEVLPHVLDVIDAMGPDAPLLHDDLFTKGVDPAPDKPSNVALRRVIERGDVEQGFRDAHLVIEREFDTAAVHQGYIEPHAVVARMGEDGQAVVWCCTQGHFTVRNLCAQVLGMDNSQIKVIPSEIGGGFGGKTTIYQEPVAVRLSQKAGRPVKMVMSREEVFRATGPTSGTSIRVKIGVDREGRITAAQGFLAYEAGAFPGSPVGPGLMTIFAPYVVENLHLEGYDVVLNKPAVAAYRAPGAPMAAFAGESVLDEVATKLGIDPIDLRLRNAAVEGTHATYGPRYKAIGYVETLEAARAHPHYRAPLGPNQGRGIASGFWFNVGMQSSAAVNINEDGSAVVVSGCPDIGGSRASLAMMAAEELGIDLKLVRPVIADTETGAYSDQTGGSRVTFATGMAVIEAARDAVSQMLERAAKMWDADVATLSWKDGSAHRPSGEVLSLREIAGKAADTGGPISGQTSLTARGAGPGFATHICDVEVDPDTGRAEVVRYTAIQDVGRAIHPSYVEGQLQGGAAQGIGWALNEEYIYDANGELENPGFLDYRVPVASDLPMIDTVLVEIPNPHHPYGVRGVGEVPIVPAIPAVANAVSAAIGRRVQSLPLSPPKLLAALQATV